MTDILILAGIVIQDDGLLHHAGSNRVILLRNYVIVAVVEAAAVVRIKGDPVRDRCHRQDGYQHT